MNDIPQAIKRQITGQKLQVWRNTLYDCELDARVAEALDDQQAKVQASNRMKNALKAIDVLDEILQGLDLKEES